MKLKYLGRFYIDYITNEEGEPLAYLISEDNEENMYEISTFTRVSDSIFDAISVITNTLSVGIQIIEETVRMWFITQNKK